MYRRPSRPNELYHWGMKKGEKAEDHKYVVRIEDGVTKAGTPKYRYFYSMAEYKAFKEGGVAQKLKNTVNAAVNKVTGNSYKERMKELDTQKNDARKAAESWRKNQRANEREGDYSQATYDRQKANTREDEYNKAVNEKARLKREYESNTLFGKAEKAIRVSGIDKTIAGVQKKVNDTLNSIFKDFGKSTNDPNAATQPAQPAQPVQSKSKLQRQINDLQSEVDNLNRIVNDLRAENQRLKEENEKMQVDLEQANGTIATQTSEIADLNQKLVNARTLLINDLTATPEKKKCGKSNKFKSTNKSGSVERISISGKILPNTVVDPGTKTFYARITKGSNLITNLGAEPKTFDMDGVDMLYTAEQDVEFYGQGRNFNMIWRKTNATNLEPGVYTVTVYNAGNEVGKTNFTLK